MYVAKSSLFLSSAGYCQGNIDITVQNTANTALLHTKVLPQTDLPQAQATLRRQHAHELSFLGLLERRGPAEVA